MSRTSASSTNKDAKPRSKYVKVARCTGSWLGGMKTALQVRGFEPFYTAEPEQAGGDNSAPTPMEYVIAALNGCLAVVIQTVAEEQSFQLDGAAFDSKGLIDQRGVEGTAGVSPQFQEVTAEIRLQTPEPPNRLDALKDEVLRRCPAFNLLRDSGIDLQVRWSAVDSLE